MKHGSILTLSILALYLALSLHAFDADAAKNRTGLSQGQKGRSSVIKQRKRIKYVAPAQEHIGSEAYPLTLPISEDVAELLAKNDIDGAIREIRTEPLSSRSLRLLREMQLISSFNRDKKIPKLEKHRFCQNLGIAYHNLFLFLKRNGKTNGYFVKKALKYYDKALSTVSPSERSEIWLLIATLKAQNGDMKGSVKAFENVDTLVMDDTASTYESIAAYYAATGNAEKAYENLKLAYEKRPEEIYTWLVIGDDFLSIENTEEFKKLVESFKKEKAPTLLKKKKRK